MILYTDCDYFNELIDDEFSPYPSECEFCYRFKICKKCYDKENLKDKSKRR